MDAIERIKVHTSRERVDFEWPAMTHAEILRALESAPWNEVRPARLLLRRKERGRDRRETRDDPDDRLNLHTTALAVGIALLGFALALQTIFRAN